MAEIKKKTIGEALLGENVKKIGEYQEAPGGGTPLAKGEKAPNDEWVAENRKMQPRDENGKFTYNSANAKKLEYGPSRGKTVPPFLRGVLCTYAVENKNVIIDENGKKYLAGIEMSAKQLVDAYKNFVGEGKEDLKFAGLEEVAKGKKGAKSKAEKEAIAGKKKGIVGGVNIYDALANSYNPKTGKKDNQIYDFAKSKKLYDKSELPDVSSEEKDLAKNDPVKLFATSKNVQAIKKLLDKKNKDIDIGAFLDKIADGGITSWGELANYINTEL